VRIVTHRESTHVGSCIYCGANDVLVRTKFFAKFDGAEYLAVIGKLKSFYADQYRLVRKAS
jgi:hypothetical protein